MRKFCQNFNRDKMRYLIKYILTIWFSMQDYTKHLHNNNLLNIPTTFILFLDFLPKKCAKFVLKSQSMTTLYV